MIPPDSGDLVLQSNTYFDFNMLKINCTYTVIQSAQLCTVHSERHFLIKYLNSSSLISVQWGISIRYSDVVKSFHEILSLNMYISNEMMINKTSHVWYTFCSAFLKNLNKKEKSTEISTVHLLHKLYIWSVVVAFNWITHRS